MHIILKTIPGEYPTHQIIASISTSNHTTTPHDTLMQTVLNFVREQGGRDSVDGMDVILVRSLSDILVPLKDGYSIYCLTDRMNRAYVYKRTTQVANGWVAVSVSYLWQLVSYYDLLPCDDIDIVTTNITTNTIRKVTDVNRTVTIDRLQSNKSSSHATLLANIIDELKNNKLFLKRRICTSRPHAGRFARRVDPTVDPTIRPFTNVLDELKNNNTFIQKYC